MTRLNKTASGYLNAEISASKCNGLSGQCAELPRGVGNVEVDGLRCDVEALRLALAGRN